MTTDYDIKRELISRLMPYLDNPSTATLNELLAQSLAELTEKLDQFTTTKLEKDETDRIEAYREQSRLESQFESVYVNAIRNVTLADGRRLSDTEANRKMFESLLNPGEVPTPAGYKTLALQFVTKFAWERPQPKQTDADRLAEFAKICRENNLSECAANQQLHREGAALENWAGASGLERAAFQAQAAQERQKFLIHSASPTQLRDEAKYQSATEREIAIKAEADRAHQFVSQAQAGMYSPLPTHNQAGEIMDSKYFRRLSTLDYPLFRQLVRKFGTSQITERLRAPASPAAVPAV
jgi:hypothetical protein